MDVIIITILLISILSSSGASYLILSNSLKIGKNKVHFYVARDENGELWLYLGKPVRLEKSFAASKNGCVVLPNFLFEKLGLDADDYKDLKWEDEPVEVFLNLEDWSYERIILDYEIG